MNSGMDMNWIILYVENVYSNENEHTATTQTVWMNVMNITLSKRSQTQRGDILH